MNQSRRSFVRSTMATGLAVSSGLSAQAFPGKRPKLKLAVKYGMIGEGKTPLEKLELVKSIGYEGVEIDSPSKIDLPALKAASEKTGIVVHGTIDSVHWNKPLSSPDEAVRAEGLKALETAIRDAHFFGAKTALLVPGVARGGVTYDECFERSAAEVKKVLPLAEEIKVVIGIETVWNDFITKPEQMVAYVDQFKSPWVGAYFDCSNMLKYGVPSATWIRTLGKRLVKFDFKGFNMNAFNEKKNPWCKIGEGTEDWPDILTALAEVGYEGFTTSEVGGGGREVLTDVFNRMKKVLEIA
ncbi:MAG: sugar phosphate isomerase/epimerase family protein [Isosphaeraceae bacterium]